MPGPAPKPTALKKLAGNPGKRKLVEGPQFSGTVTAPTFLNKTAKAEWNRVTKELKALDMLRAVDSSSLAAYCQSYSRWIDAEKLIDKEGQTVNEPIVNKAGEVVGHKTRKHPAVSISQAAVTVMLRSAALFGFSPAERSRVHMPDSKPKSDPFAEFMKDIGADDD